MTTILLAGATGLVGSKALALLLEDDRVAQVVAPTRKLLPAHPKLLNPMVDSVSLPANADWWQVDGAICALGTTRSKAGSAHAFRAIDHDYVLAVARHVRNGGARRFALTSSMGANARSPFLYTRTKGEVEDAIAHMAFPSLTILRPGLLGGERIEKRSMERLADKFLRLAAPVMPASARISPATTVARLLVQAALNADDGIHIIPSAEIAGRA